MRSFTAARGARRLHVVDVENLIGGGTFAADEVTRLRDTYLSATRTPEHDQVVLGASGGDSALAAGLGWAGKRVVLRYGVDGADLALLTVLEDEGVPARFGSVFIASGDGIFAEAASQLAGYGVSVTVVSRARSLSRRLRLAATNVVLLDGPTPAPARSGDAA